MAIPLITDVVAAMSRPPAIPIPTTSARGWPGCHSGMAKPRKTAKPTSQADAVATIQRFA